MEYKMTIKCVDRTYTYIKFETVDEAVVALRALYSPVAELNENEIVKVEIERIGKGLKNGI